MVRGEALGRLLDEVERVEAWVAKHAATLAGEPPPRDALAALTSSPVVAINDLDFRSGVRQILGRTSPFVPTQQHPVPEFQPLNADRR